MHVNAVAYNADLDQIAMSSPSFNEIWIIDHSTTTEEAKGHSGGLRRKGGDLLYRWGNPRAYRNGSSGDRRLFGQHNIQWISRGLLGEGHLLVFNNGGGRPRESYSSVDEFVPPTDKDGNYIRENGGAFGPAEAIWSYTAPTKKDFYSWFISGAQRLPNGNTLINSGATGVVFEVTPGKETVWKFANPFKPTGGGPPPAVAKTKAQTDGQKGAGPVSKKAVATVGPGPGGPPRAGNTLFRATRFALDFPAFRGKVLKPGKTLVEAAQDVDNPRPARETTPANPKTADAASAGR
jgi:hypothetical protein